MHLGRPIKTLKKGGNMKTIKIELRTTLVIWAFVTLFLISPFIY